jgi:hypothetical protein
MLRPIIARVAAVMENDPRLLRFLARHCATGVVAGLSLMLGLIWTDVGRIGSLMDNSEIGWIAMLMLSAGFAGTGGAVGMGVAVMALGGRDR